MERDNAEKEVQSAIAGYEEALARTSMPFSSEKGFLVHLAHANKIKTIISQLGIAHLKTLLLPVVEDTTRSERIRKWAIDFLVSSHLNWRPYPTPHVEYSLRDRFFEMSENDDFIKQELDQRPQLKGRWFVATERIAFVGIFLLLAAFSALFGWEAKWGESTQTSMLGVLQTFLLGIPTFYLVCIVGANYFFLGYFNPFIDRSIERQPPSFSLKRLVTSSYIILSVIALVIAVWIGAAIVGVIFR